MPQYCGPLHGTDLPEEEKIELKQIGKDDQTCFTGEVFELLEPGRMTWQDSYNYAESQGGRLVLETDIYQYLFVPEILPSEY